MNNKSVLKKYETIVSNIEWHIKTNEPPEEEIEKLNEQLDIYREVVHDFSDELPNLPKSTENLSKIKNKDEWLNEVRGNEEIECVMGCKVFTGGEKKHHPDCPFYPDSMSRRYDEMEKIIGKPIGEDELVKKFKNVLPMGMPSVLNDCIKIAKQYSDSKLSELEKWIDEEIGKFSVEAALYPEGQKSAFRKVKDKINSLKK